MDDVLNSLWNRLGLGEAGPVSGVNWALPALEALADRSTSIMLKLDGERHERPWTIVISGGVMGDNFFRTDEESASLALVAALRAVALEGVFD